MRDNSRFIYMMQMTYLLFGVVYIMGFLIPTVINRHYPLSLDIFFIVTFIILWSLIVMCFLKSIIRIIQIYTNYKIKKSKRRSYDLM